MSAHLAIRILEWRCGVAASGTYLQGFYQSIDRKQWDRAERMSHGAREFLDRNHPELRSDLVSRVGEFRSQGALDDCVAEQSAWRCAIQSLMCLASLFGMIGEEGKGVAGLRGWRSDATKSLGVALQASQTAFPREELVHLVDEALRHALEAATCALVQDLRESGDVNEGESGVITHSVREACEAALRGFVREQLGG